MVDTVLYFEGDRHASYRILRGVKNRFGSTNEIGVFEMRTEGLVEVEDPSRRYAERQATGSIGVYCGMFLMEGTRPILIEIQALVCHSNFGIPRRTAAGTDFNRVNLLMAVLEKRLALNLSACDAYVNIAGGIRMTEPAIDLGIVLAIISSFEDSAYCRRCTCFWRGGIKWRKQRDSSIWQSSVCWRQKKLGFKQVILPKVCMSAVEKVMGIELLPVLLPWQKLQN